MQPFLVWGHNNGLHFFRNRADVRRCGRCKELLQKWNEPLVSTVIPRTLKRDVSTSYDGVVVVSSRFVEACKTANLIGLAFTPLSAEFSAVRPQREIAYDTGRRGTRFEDKCSECGHYKTIVGATPAFLVPPVRVGALEFVRSDIEFGSDDEKAPLIICGAEAARILKAALLKGLDLETVKE